MHCKDQINSGDLEADAGDYICKLSFRTDVCLDSKGMDLRGDLVKG